MEHIESNNYVCKRTRCMQKAYSGANESKSNINTNWFPFEDAIIASPLFK